MRVTGIHKLLLAGLCCGFSSPLEAQSDGVKPLGAFPEADRLWMGMEEGVVRPAAYEQVRAESDGHIALTAEDGQVLKKGELWAILDPEQLELERESLELETSRQEQQLSKGRADLEESRLRSSLSLHEARGKRDDLLEVSRDDGIPAELRKRAGEAAAKMQQQVDLTEEKLSPATMEREIHLLEEDARLQIARKKKQFLALERRSKLIAGFDGLLRFGDAFKETLAATPEGELPWVKGGVLVGTIMDEDRYEIIVSASGPLVAEIPREELLVFLQDPQTGGLIAGDYARTEEFDSGKEITRNYIFTVREDGTKGARQSLGTRCLVHVYRKFDRPYRLVYKKDIAFSAPEILEKAGWDGLVRTLWPGSQVIQVGPQTIAVEPKNEN